MGVAGRRVAALLNPAASATGPRRPATGRGVRRPLGARGDRAPLRRAARPQVAQRPGGGRRQTGGAAGRGRGARRRRRGRRRDRRQPHPRRTDHGRGDQPARRVGRHDHPRGAARHTARRARSAPLEARKCRGTRAVARRVPTVPRDHWTDGARRADERLARRRRDGRRPLGDVVRVRRQDSP
jgi:hypothetical protein